MCRCGDNSCRDRGYLFERPLFFVPHVSVLFGEFDQFLRDRGARSLDDIRGRSHLDLRPDFIEPRLESCAFIA